MPATITRGSLLRDAMSNVIDASGSVTCGESSPIVHTTAPAMPANNMARSLCARIATTNSIAPAHTSTLIKPIENTVFAAWYITPPIPMHVDWPMPSIVSWWTAS